jgi:cytochrome c biogenesis protein CcmG, thiol:disulfide interchange protein DsbE
MRPIARSLSVAAVLALSSFSAAHSALADDGAVKLQGKGPNRDALDAMTYKPFDAALWSKVTDWQGGNAPSAESTKGKPVLVVVWAAWYKTSHGALAEAQKLADKNKDLVVVGVHHAKGFDKAAEVLSTNKITFPVGHDATTAFFPAMHTPAAGPNFYIIDRAGNLRFADVEKSSVEDAVKIVVDESAADAAKAQDRAKEAKKEGGDAPLGGPEVKVRVTPDDYKAVKWPAANKGQLSAKNLQGKPLPVKLGKEKWLGKEPDRDGRIIVIDFWATWCPPCKAAMPHLDELYKKYSKDVVVIGISDEEDAKVKAFIKAAKHSYPQAVDPTGAVKNALGVEGIPHVVVLSTDGVIRWQGNPYPGADLEGLQNVVAKLIELDPGVKARREREKKAG